MIQSNGKKISTLFFLLLLTLAQPTEAAESNKESCAVDYKDLTENKKVKTTVPITPAKILEKQIIDLVTGILIPISKSGQKIMIYPIIGPFRVLKETGRTIKNEGITHIWKVPFRIIAQDGAAIAGAVTVHQIVNRLALNDLEFDQDTAEFKSNIGESIYVYANLIPKGVEIHEAGKIDFYAEYEDYPNTFYIEAKNESDLIYKLNQIKNKTGKPIFGLEISAHGLPGYMQGININAIQKDLSLMAKGGKIKLRSCLVGNGEIGTKYLKELGSRMLSGGGTIYASQKYIVKSPLYMGNHINRKFIDTPLEELFFKANGPDFLMYQLSYSNWISNLLVYLRSDTYDYAGRPSIVKQLATPPTKIIEIPSK